MSAYLITYDLNKVGQNYEKVYEEIKKLGSWAHWLDSTWFVKSSLTADEIVGKLKKHFDSNDTLFVVEMTSNYQGLLNENQWEFLRENIFD